MARHSNASAASRVAHVRTAQKQFNDRRAAELDRAINETEAKRPVFAPEPMILNGVNKMLRRGVDGLTDTGGRTHDRVPAYGPKSGVSRKGRR